MLNEFSGEKNVKILMSFPSFLQNAYKRDLFLSFTLSETNLSDLTAFMVSPDECYSIWIPHLIVYQ